MFVTVLRSDTHLVLYVNGNMDSALEVMQGVPTDGKSLFVGRMPWQDTIGGGCNVDYLFDEFKVWDKVIDESRIFAEAGLALGAGVNSDSIELG